MSGKRFSKWAFFKLLNKLVAVDVVGGESVLRRHQTQGRGQMGLANAGRAEKHHIFSVFQETHGGQLVDLALINGGLEGKSSRAENLV